MSNHDDHFAEFKAHTLFKHLIFNGYLKAWAMILLSKLSRVWIINAFAGAGKDELGNNGSPVIAAKIAVQVQDRLGHGKRVTVVAIEKDAGRFRRLEAAMAPYDIDRSGPHPVAYLRHSTFAEKVDGLLQKIGEEPAFFFLDPFGVDGLKRDVVKKILEGERREVLLMFSDESAVRLLGVVASEVPDLDREVAKLQDRPSLFPEFDVEDQERRRREVEASARALGYTKPAAERILREAYGDESATNELIRTSISRRPERAVEMYVELLITLGATYVLPFALRTADNRHAYYLIHASKSPRAFTKMKAVIGAAINKSALPDDAKESMTIHITTDLQPILEAVRKKFAGKRVRWTGTQDSVKEFVLAETRFYSHMGDDLKKELASYAVSKRPLEFAFPGATDG